MRPAPRGVALLGFALACFLDAPASAQSAPSVASAPSGSSSAAARSPGAAPSPGDRARASKAFADGERAFGAGDFRTAATNFEEAYRLAPHESALWNAGKSRQRAGDLPEAANHYARVLEDAPALSPERKDASQALSKLSTKLGRLDLHDTEGVRALKIDGLPTSAKSVFVYPGSHTIVWTRDSEDKQRVVTVNAGATTSLAFAESTPERAREITPPVVAPAVGPTVTQPPSEARTVDSSAGLPRAFVYVGGALTLVSLGLTIASGVDTLHARDEFVRAPTAEKLEGGHDKQTRTNVLIGVTAGLFVLTSASALVFVDWNDHDAKKDHASTTASLRVLASTNSVWIDGTF